MNAVAALLANDAWSVAERNAEVGPAVILFRTPVLGPEPVEGYGQLVTVVWAYGPQGNGEMPSSDTIDELTRFEDHLCIAVESDAQSVLTGVLTFDGARQWVFYTRDVETFGERLSRMPDYHGEPYPIELTMEEDAGWSYLREQILGRVLEDT